MKTTLLMISILFTPHASWAAGPSEVDLDQLEQGEIPTRLSFTEHQFPVNPGVVSLNTDTSSESGRKWLTDFYNGTASYSATPCETAGLKVILQQLNTKNRKLKEMQDDLKKYGFKMSIDVQVDSKSKGYAVRRGLVEDYQYKIVVNAFDKKGQKILAKELATFQNDKRRDSLGTPECMVLRDLKSPKAANILTMEDSSTENLPVEFLLATQPQASSSGTSCRIIH